MDDEDIALAGELGDRREIPERVVGELLVQARIGGDSRVHPQQRVAVGHGLRHELRRDIAAGAAAVIDHELLADRAGELLRHHAHDDVRPAARRDRQHQAYRLGGITLSDRGSRKEQRQGCQ